MVDAEGRRQFLAGEKVTMTLPAIRGSIAVVNNDTFNGRFDVVISDVAAPKGVKEVKVPIWSDVNGQDDLNWYTARRVGDGTYRVSVDSANHGYSQGKYNIHLYYIQNDNQMIGIGTSSAQMLRTRVDNQKERILQAASAMIGVRGGSAEHTRLVNDYNSIQPLPVGYAVKTWDDWCDIFVTVLFQREGLSHLIGRECGVERHINIFKQKGIWNEDGNATPQRGDLITFNWDENRQPNNGFAAHIGIVEKVENGIIYTREIVEILSNEINILLAMGIFVDLPVLIIDNVFRSNQRKGMYDLILHMIQ